MISILYLRNKDFGAVSQTEFARVKFRVWCRLQNVIYIYYKILLTILSFAYGETLRKQTTFGDATTVFPAKWRLRNVVPCWKFDSTNPKHYPDLVVTRHQYGISTLVSQTSFGGETCVVASPNDKFKWVPKILKDVKRFKYMYAF